MSPRAAWQHELEPAQKKTIQRPTVKTTVTTNQQVLIPGGREEVALSEARIHPNGDGEMPSKGSTTPSRWHRAQGSKGHYQEPEHLLGVLLGHLL